MKKVSLVAAIALLVAPAVSMAAPSWALTVGGASSLDVVTPAAGYTLALEARMDSDSQPVGGYQHALIASQPGLWQYGTPAWTPVAAGISAGDLFTPALDGQTLPGDNGGEMLVFKASGQAGPFAAGTHVETITIQAIGALPLGSYTFRIGDSGNGHFLTNNNGTFDFDANASQAFTLNVVPEPASALLLLGALPFLRRRKVVA